MKSIVFFTALFFFAGVVLGILLAPIKKGVTVNVKNYNQCNTAKKPENDSVTEVSPLSPIKPVVKSYKGTKLFHNEDLLTDLIN